ncbi:MAG: sigma-70 family RNA polymerase sigma factor [Rhodanobacteraceae bacterium]
MNDALSHESPADSVDLAECEAVTSVLAGNADAFRVLVQRHQQRTFALALMMTRERQAAEEVTQDAFLNAYRHLDRYDSRRPFYPWLAAIAARLAQTWLRRHARQRLDLEPSMDILPAPQRQDLTAPPLKTLIADEQGRKLWAQVESLTAGERTVVVSYYRQQLRVTEIAHQLGVTTGTVKTLLYRARRKLRERLADEPDFTSREETP